MKLLLIIAVLAFCSCGAKQDPRMTTFTFQDDINPCIKVVFTDTATLGKVRTNDESSTYSFNMDSHPELALTLEKQYSEDGGLRFTPVNQRFVPLETIYEILPSDNFPTRSAAVVFVRDDKGIYLTSLIGEGNSQEAFLFSVKILVQRSEHLASFSGTQWVSTPAGKRFIENMVGQAHWYYNNIVSCSQAESMLNELDEQI